MKKGYASRMLASIFGVIAVVMLAHALAELNAAGWVMNSPSAVSLGITGILAALAAASFLIHRFQTR